MRYLFLVLTLLGLVSYGDLIGARGTPAGPQGRRSAPIVKQTTPDVVIISEDGTPYPRH